MINERNQEAFLDLVRPPADYQLTYCIGTTFTLELPCLVQMALNSRGNKKLVEELSVHEGFEIINDFSSKCIVFTQNCRIKSLPPELMTAGNTQKGRFFSLLDTMVAEVPTESKLSAFHPKVWFLRFDPTEGNGEPIFKHFTMSRNLTSTLNWDVSLCLIGKQGNGSSNKELQTFLETLVKKSSSRKQGSKIIQSALKDLQNIEFDLPDRKTYKSSEFKYKWGKEKGFENLNISSCNRAIVISPFLSESQLKSLTKIKNLHLITSSTDLDKVNKIPELHDKTYILNIEGMDLHSKMYLIERDTHSNVILGSTNFTHSAWYGDNVEAHINLETAKNVVERFVSDFILDDKGRTNNWLKKFEPIDAKVEKSQEELQKIEQEFDDIQGLLSTGEFILEYKNGKAKLTYDGEIVILPKGLKGSISIIGSKQALNLDTVLNDGDLLNDVKISELSSFLVITLKYKGKTREFCTVAIANFNRYQRNKSILSSSIKDWQSFWDYLGVILNIESSAGSSKEGGSGARKTRSSHKNNRSTKWRYLEPVLLAGVSDSGVIDKIETAISALKSNKKDDLNEENLKTFLEFWKEYKSAYEVFKQHG